MLRREIIPKIALGPEFPKMTLLEFSLGAQALERDERSVARGRDQGWQFCEGYLQNCPSAGQNQVGGQQGQKFISFLP